MGLDPDNPKVGRLLPLAMEAFGKPQINWIGDKSVYENGENISEVFIKSLSVIEEAYAFNDCWLGYGQVFCFQEKGHTNNYP